MKNSVNVEVSANGELVLNIYDILSCVESERVDDIIDALTWNTSVMRNVKDALREGYASPTYNSTIHNMRTAFFLVPPEEYMSWSMKYETEKIFYAMKNTVEELLREAIQYREESYRKSRDAYKTMNIARNYMSEDSYNAFRNEVSAATKVDLSPYVVANQATKDVKDTVEEAANRWTQAMLEYFNQEDKDE